MGFWSSWVHTDASTTRVEARRDVEYGDRIRVIAGELGDMELSLTREEADVLALQIMAAAARLETGKPDWTRTPVEQTKLPLRD
jgi:hypothetical protein